MRLTLEAQRMQIRHDGRVYRLAWHSASRDEALAFARTYRSRTKNAARVQLIEKTRLRGRYGVFIGLNEHWACRPPAMFGIKPRRPAGKRAREIYQGDHW